MTSDGRDLTTSEGRDLRRHDERRPAPRPSAADRDGSLSSRTGHVTEAEQGGRHHPTGPPSLTPPRPGPGYW